MRYEAGFYLLETMISFAVVTLFLAIALPGLRDFLWHSQENRLQSQLLQVLRFAHREAKAQGGIVTLCQSKDHQTCSGTWRDGQLVFVDANGDGRVHQQTQVLASMQSPLNHGMLHWRSFPRYHGAVQFSPSGLTQSDNGTFWFCRSIKDKPAWAIALNQSGRARVIEPDKKGRINDSQGKILVCNGAASTFVY